ncbi:hypothetical protein V8P95_15165 [Acinetobacter baumannii]
MSNAMFLTNLAVEKKREGRVKDAIRLYKQALEIDSFNPIIYTSLAKSLYLENLRSESFNNYFKGLSLSLIYYMQEHGIKKDRLDDEYFRAELISNFFSTITHIAHTFIDLDEEQTEEFIDIISNNNPQLTRDKIKKIVKYEIANYRFGLAGGVVNQEPVAHNLEPIYHDIDHDINFLELYRHHGLIISLAYLQWDNIAENLD